MTNKVEFAGNVLIDLTSDTVTASKMLSGTIAHDKSGTIVTGNIASKTDSGTTTLTASSATKSFGAGYYANAHEVKVEVYDGTVI